MENEVKSGLETMPKEIAGRAHVVELQGGASFVVVKKWSFAKFQMIAKWISDLVNTASAEDKATIESGDAFKIATMAVSRWGEKVISFLKLCVRQEDDEKVTPDLDLEDVVAMLAATIELNFTEGFKKKAQRLMGAFRQQSPAGDPSTP